MSLRVIGTDPGTASLDLIHLEGGAVRDQCRFGPRELEADPAAPTRWMLDRRPLDLVAGPSGYGLPLVPLRDCTERDRELLLLVRPDDRDAARGLVGLSGVLRDLRAADLPVVFLPGVIHLPTVPAHRKINRIDLGTPDKLCVAALALAQWARQEPLEENDFCVVELGSAFTACLVVRDGRVVDGRGGTGGAFGWRSGGAWDGEAAYWLSPLSKRDLFGGGVQSVAESADARLRFRESVLQTVAGLQAVTPFRQVVLSGRLLETEPDVVAELAGSLATLGTVSHLESLPGAWVKHAAQGAALLVDGLAGGSYAPLVDRLRLREAAGTVLDWLRYRTEGKRGAEVL